MKLNKFVQLFCLGGAIAIATPACTDLENRELDSVVVKGAGTTFEGDASELLRSAYSDFGAYTDQNNIYALGAHTSDEMIPPTRGVDWGDNGVWRTLHAHTWDATHASVLTAFNQLNERVFRTNQVLVSTKPAPSAQEAAEAKFIRAFNMYLVMDYFGQVPFRNVDEGVDVNPRVFTRKEAYDLVLKDLTEALPNLVKGGPSASNTKVTKAAANAMLARLLLNKAVFTSDNPAGPYTFAAADMDKVIQYADAVTADGYSLEDDYFANFTKEAKSEVILVSTSGTPQNRWMMTLHYDQNPSGWNGFTTLADFYAKFQDGDQRKGRPAKPDGKEFSGIGLGFLVGQQFKNDGSILQDSRSKKPLQFTPDVPLAGAGTAKGIRVIKYHPATAGQYILLRYADVVLMKAEAQLRKGDAPGALATVNALRAKRGAAPLTALTEAAMLDERGRELYWEGNRRSDQVRFGAFTGTWAAKTNTEAHRVLFPIPQQALDSNPNLKQNTGY